MIEGLKVTVKGSELRTIAEARAAHHTERAATYAEQIANFKAAAVEGMAGQSNTEGAPAPTPDTTWKKCVECGTTEGQIVGVLDKWVCFDAYGCARRKHAQRPTGAEGTPTYEQRRQAVAKVAADIDYFDRHRLAYMSSARFGLDDIRTLLAIASEHFRPVSAPAESPLCACGHPNHDGRCTFCACGGRGVSAPPTAPDTTDRPFPIHNGSQPTDWQRPPSPVEVMPSEPASETLEQTFSRWSRQGRTDDYETPIDAYGQRVLSMVIREIKGRASAPTEEPRP